MLFAARYGDVAQPVSAARLAFQVGIALGGVVIQAAGLEEFPVFEQQLDGRGAAFGFLEGCKKELGLDSVLRKAREALRSTSDKSSLKLVAPGRRIRTVRWRAHLVVGVVGLRPLRPRRAGGRVTPGPWRRKPARRSARRDGSQREPFHRVEPFHRGVWMHRLNADGRMRGLRRSTSDGVRRTGSNAG